MADNESIVILAATLAATSPLPSTVDAAFLNGGKGKEKEEMILIIVIHSAFDCLRRSACNCRKKAL